MLKKVIFFGIMFLTPFFIKAKLTTEELDTFRLREASASFIEKQNIIIDGKLN